MKSITRRRPALAMRLCCGHGSAKRPDLRSNGSRKFCVEVMASCCQRLGRSGVRSMRKPAGPAAYLSRCASSFRFERAVVLVLVVLLVPYTAVATGERGGDRRGEQRKLNIERRALSVGRCNLHLPSHAPLSLVIARRFSNQRCCISTGKSPV